MWHHIESTANMLFNGLSDIRNLKVQGKRCKILKSSNSSTSKSSLPFLNIIACLGLAGRALRWRLICTSTCRLPTPALRHLAPPGNNRAVRPSRLGAARGTRQESNSRRQQKRARAAAEPCRGGERSARLDGSRLERRRRGSAWRLEARRMEKPGAARCA